MSRARGPEEVDGHHLGQPLAQAEERRPRALGPACPRRRRDAPCRADRARLPRQRGVVGVARRREERLDRPRPKPLHEARLADGASPPPRDDLPAHPLEVLEGLLAARQDVHGVLDGDRAQALQTSADLDAQVAGLGRDLVDEEEPARPGRPRA